MFDSLWFKLLFFVDFGLQHSCELEPFLNMFYKIEINLNLDYFFACSQQSYLNQTMAKYTEYHVKLNSLILNHS